MTPQPDPNGLTVNPLGVNSVNAAAGRAQARNRFTSRAWVASGKHVEGMLMNTLATLMGDYATSIDPMLVMRANSGKGRSCKAASRTSTTFASAARRGARR